MYHTLGGRFTKLRPPDPSDYEWLYRLAHEAGTHSRYRNRGQVVRPEAFGETLWNGVLVQFVVEATRDSMKLGLVSFYGVDHRNGTCNVAVLADPVARGNGWPAEGFVTAMSFVFRNWPIRKIYGDVIEPNVDQFKSAFGSLFVQEGCLKAHELLDGHYLDVHILACDVEHFERWFDRLSSGGMRAG